MAKTTFQVCHPVDCFFAVESGKKKVFRFPTENNDSPKEKPAGFHEFVETWRATSPAR